MSDDTLIQVSARRPVSVTIMALSVLSIAIYNLVGLIQVISSFELLKQLLSFSPAWLGAARLFWGGMGLIIAWGLWVGLPWAPRLTRLAAACYAIYLWIDRIFLYDPAGRGANIPFMISVTILLLAFVYLVLASKVSYRYFSSMDERTHG